MKLDKLVGERFRERPAGCVIESHALMVRGGYMKGIANGIFSQYPPLRRVTRKLEQIIREEMDAIGGQEVSMPVVLPGAQVKIFLTASAGDRARRRYDDLIARGDWVSYEQVLADVERRDYNDTHRAAAPLRPAADAVTVDTTGFTFDDAFALLLSTIRARLGQEG